MVGYVDYNTFLNQIDSQCLKYLQVDRYTREGLFRAQLGRGDTKPETRLHSIYIHQTYKSSVSAVLALQQAKPQHIDKHDKYYLTIV